MDGDIRQFEKSPLFGNSEGTDPLISSIDQPVKWQIAYDRFQQLLNEQDFYHAGEILEFMEQNGCPILLLTKAWKDYIHLGISHHLAEAEEARYDAMNHPEVFREETAAVRHFMYAGLSEFGIDPDPDFARRLDNLPDL